MHLLRFRSPAAAVRAVVRELTTTIAARYRQRDRSGRRRRTRRRQGSRLGHHPARPSPTPSPAWPVLAGRAVNCCCSAARVKVEDAAPPGLRQLRVQEVDQGGDGSACMQARPLPVVDPLPVDALPARSLRAGEGAPAPCSWNCLSMCRRCRFPEGFDEPSALVSDLTPATLDPDPKLVAELAQRIGVASRPVLLLGGPLPSPGPGA